jgi:potassium efflux system protein
MRWTHSKNKLVLTRIFIVGLLVAVPLAGSAAAAVDSKPGAAAAAVKQDLETKLAEARVRLAAVETLDAAALTNRPLGSPQDVAVRRALQQRLVRLLEQQLSNASELETTKRRYEELEREAQAGFRLAGSPPYSVLLTDRLREEIQAERLKINSGEAAIVTTDRMLAQSRSTLGQAEEKIRQLNEQLEKANDPETAARLSSQRELERLRSQVAAAGVGLLDSERQLRQTALAESRLRLGGLQRQLVIADADARFTQADLDVVLTRIEDNSVRLERELAAVRVRRETALKALEVVRGELDRPGADAEARLRAAEVVATRQAELETAQAAMRMLRLLLESESVERAMWEVRFAAHGSHSAVTLSESKRRLENFVQQSALWRDYQQQQVEVFPSQIEIQESRIRNLAPDSDLLPLARERLAALRERDELLQRLVRRMEHVRRLGERWAEGLRAAEGRLPFTGRVQNLFSDTGSFLRKLWTFELFAAEDTITVDGQPITGRRSVTLGKVVTAVLILALGVWITGLISRVAEPVIIRRLKIEVNQARLIRRWFRAFMVVCLVLFSLMSVKIPLTVFAFAGGALAIALGFGMQTMLKNFVSGLILLFERPFRVGDVLDVGGQRGTVTEIGLRASVLQLWDGIETLIPNSSLLENNVSNWTYSSRKVRFSITVGVAYGSDTRRVIQLLEEVAERHGVVEKEPKPQVLFTDFGESALTFELRYWVDVIKANSSQVGSDMRQMIAGAFAEHGVVIAFPQRDLNITTAHPIPVSVVPAAAQPSPVGPGVDRQARIEPKS